MSIEAMVAVLNAQFPKTMKPTTKYACLALANYANRYGENVWPSLQTLTRVTGLSRDTLRRAIDELEPAKLLVQVAPARYDFPAEYRIDLDALDALPRSDPRKARGSHPATPGGGKLPPQGSQPAAEGSQGATQSVSKPSEEPPEVSNTSAAASAAEGRRPPGVRDPEVREAVKHWAELWERQRGAAPHIEWPRACGQLGKVVRARGLATAKTLLDKFFASDDRFICRSDYSLGAFLGNVNKLIGRAPAANGTGKVSQMMQGLKNFGDRRADHGPDRGLPAGDAPAARRLPSSRHEPGGD